MNDCVTYSSELPKYVNLRVLRKYNKRYILKMKYRDGTYQDWSFLVGATLTVYLGTDTILTLIIGDGLTIDPTDSTNIILQLWGANNDKTLPIGYYPYEFIADFTDSIVRYLLKGIITVINTKN